jgi:predicted RNase H-like nuclease (RuvC/YqgF family)
MTKIELEQKIEELEAEKVALGSVIESQAQQIIEYQPIADEVVQLRNDKSDLTQKVAELQAKVNASQDNSQFMELGRSWIHTSIGQRVMSEPTIDTAPFLLGVMAGDFLMIQDTYRFILKRLHQLGKPATPVEMQEITDLLVRTGFAAK